MDGEDQGASGREPGDDWGEDSEGDGLRGWISPDDRLWRHPSESGHPTAARRPDLGGPPPLAAPARSRTGPWVVGGAATCIVLALIAAGLVMTTSTSDESGGTTTDPGTASLIGAPTTDPGVVQTTGPANISAMLAPVRRSTVALTIERAGGDSSATGLVAESGGIIATTSAAVAGARSIIATESDGSRQLAELVGTDPTSGIAVVRISDDLPAATIDDSSDLALGSMATAMALDPGKTTNSAPTPVVYAGTVLSSGQAVEVNDVKTTFSTTELEAPLTHDDLGCPLLDAKGRVIGVLARTARSGSSAVSMFLPADFVLGVVRQLVSSGDVDHGWLGVTTSDAVASTVTTASTTSTASAPPGARLDAVAAESPAAAAGLQVGDVITSLDGMPVQSDAEFRTCLYVDPPGTTVQVTVANGTMTTTMPIVLADQGGDAPGDQSSP